MSPKWKSHPLQRRPIPKSCAEEEETKREPKAEKHK
jgi:hypothetical protein